MNLMNRMVHFQDDAIVIDMFLVCQESTNVNTFDHVIIDAVFAQKPKSTIWSYQMSKLFIKPSNVRDDMKEASRSNRYEPIIIIKGQVNLSIDSDEIR